MVWGPSPNGKFNTAHTWKHLYGNQNKVSWYNLVWFQGAYPRHSFLMWLAVQKKLSTHDRIQSFTPGPLACTLCYKGMEDHSHLFFNCTYSGFIWQDLKRRMKINTNANTWEDIVIWSARVWSKKKAAHIIPKMAIGASIYHLWRERNTRTFRHEFKTKERILQDICTYMRAHISIKWKHDINKQGYMDVWD